MHSIAFKTVKRFVDLFANWWIHVDVHMRWQFSSFPCNEKQWITVAWVWSPLLLENRQSGIEFGSPWSDFIVQTSQCTWGTESTWSLVEAFLRRRSMSWVCWGEVIRALLQITQSQHLAPAWKLPHEAKWGESSQHSCSMRISVNQSPNEL